MYHLYIYIYAYANVSVYIQVLRMQHLLCGRKYVNITYSGDNWNLRVIELLMSDARPFAMLVSLVCVLSLGCLCWCGRPSQLEEDAQFEQVSNSRSFLTSHFANPGVGGCGMQDVFPFSWCGV